MINRLRYIDHNRQLSNNHVPSSRSIGAYIMNCDVKLHNCYTYRPLLDLLPRVSAKVLQQFVGDDDIHPHHA